MKKTSRIILWIVAFFGLSGSLAAFMCYRRDDCRLRVAALSAITDEGSAEDRALTLMHWVHHHTATAKTNDYFVVPSLGATPMQVLAHGGDCTDRSRLLTALLRAMDIPATVALCFDEATGLPSHTVVEAQVGPNAFMVLDPAYKLSFPKPDSSGYFGLLDLRRNPDILARRVDKRCDEIPRYRPIHWYDRRRASYYQASTFNWNKNAITRMAHDLLWIWTQDDLYRIRRPVIIESPQLAVSAFSATSATFALGTIWVLNRRSIRKNKSLRRSRGVRTTPNRHSEQHDPRLQSEGAVCGH